MPNYNSSTSLFSSSSSSSVSSSDSPSAATQRTRNFPRNIYSFSSEKARRDLKFKSRDSVSASPPLQQQIEVFEQKNLFGPDFDVIEELTLNKERYVAYGPDKEQITVYGIPSLVSYNIERIKHKLIDKIGINPIISCCVSYGVSQLYKNPNIRDLADFRDALLEDRIANSSRDVIEFYDLLKSFKIDIPDGSAGLSGNKATVLIPEWLAQSLGGLAAKLGAPKTSLVIICCMFTLATQPTTTEDHQKQLSYSIDTFLRRVEMRKRIASILLETL